MSEQVRPSRTTSPPSPSFSLSDCVQSVELLYKQYGHSPFSRAEIAAALSLSSTSGPFRQRLASLKMFNLITPVADGQFTVSQTFERLHFSDTESPDYKKAALNVISSAPSFKQIISQSAGKLPDSKTLARKLETEMGFTHHTAARTAKILHSSLAGAGLIDPKGNLVSVRDTYGQPVEPNASEAQPVTLSHPTQSAKVLRTEIPLENGRLITIEYPPSLSLEDGEKIHRVITALAG